MDSCFCDEFQLHIDGSRKINNNTYKFLKNIYVYKLFTKYNVVNKARETTKKFTIKQSNVYVRVIGQQEGREKKIGWKYINI